MPRINRPRPEAPTARPFRPPRSARGVLPPRGLFVAIACAGDRHLRLCHQEEGQSIQNFPLVSSSRLHPRLSTPVLPEFLNPVNRHIRSRFRVGSPLIRLRIRMPPGGSISRPWIQVDRHRRAGMPVPVVPDGFLSISGSVEIAKKDWDVVRSEFLGGVGPVGNSKEQDGLNPCFQERDGGRVMVGHAARRTGVGPRRKPWWRSNHSKGGCCLAISLS